MKGAGDAPILLNGHRFLSPNCKDLHLLSRIFESWSPDEDAFRLAGSRATVPIDGIDEGVDLAAVTVALHRDIDQRPASRIFPFIAAQQDGTGTGPQQSEIPGGCFFLDMGSELMQFEEVAQGSALTTGHHQMGNLLQLLGGPYLDGIGTCGMESSQVGFHRALESENRGSNRLQGYQPRS